MAKRRHWPELLVILTLATLYVLKDNPTPPPPPPRATGWNVDGIQPGMTYADALRIQGLPQKFRVNPQSVVLFWRHHDQAVWFRQGKAALCSGQNLYKDQQCVADPRTPETELEHSLGTSRQTEWGFLEFPAVGICCLGGFFLVDLPVQGSIEQSVVSRIWGDLATVELDGLIPGSREAPKKTSTEVHYTASGYIDRISGTEAEWFSLKRCLAFKVGDPAPESNPKGLIITTKDGKITALRAQVNDQPLLDALDREAAYRAR